MYQTLKEKRYYVLGLKVNRIEKNMNFFKRNFFAVAGVIILLSFWVPMDERIIKAFGSYKNGVIASATVYISLSFLCHYIWNWQDRKKIKKLQIEMEQLKIEILKEGGKLPEGF